LDLNKIYCGDAKEILQTFPDKVFNCCVTSPPYFGLRSYLQNDDSNKQYEIGTEQTPEEYVNNLVNVFREVKRTLTDTGLLFINLGDSYAGSWGNSGHRPELDGTPSYQREKNGDYINRGGWDQRRERPATSYKLPGGIKPKDLIGIPWMVAFALRNDGWWLRSDIIWAKGVSGQKELTAQICSAAHEIGIEENKVEELLAKLNLYVGNPMPESIRDRCTRSHEYLFMLAKSKKYYYDNLAIAEDLVRPDEATRKTPGRFGGADKFIEASKQSRLHSGNEYKGTSTGTRNRRSVWTITTKPFKGAHFAAFPIELIEPCILAGTSGKGYCPICGEPWKRVVQRKETGWDGSVYGKRIPLVSDSSWQKSTLGSCNGKLIARYETSGWELSCSCSLDHAWTLSPGIVLDPFMGAGTTGLVAKKLGRNFVGIDLNRDYVEMAEKRINGISN